MRALKSSLSGAEFGGAQGLQLGEFGLHPLHEGLDFLEIANGFVAEDLFDERTAWDASFVGEVLWRGGAPEREVGSFVRVIATASAAG